MSHLTPVTENGIVQKQSGVASQLPRFKSKPVDRRLSKYKQRQITSKNLI